MKIDLVRCLFELGTKPQSTMPTRLERSNILNSQIESDWEAEIMRIYAEQDCDLLDKDTTSMHGKFMKNEAVTPSFLRRFPEILITRSGWHNGYYYASNENATAELLYEYATTCRTDVSVDEYFKPYFRCSKRFMHDFANWRWDDVAIDWDQVKQNIHLSREFIATYVPLEYKDFAMSVHYTEQELIDRNLIDIISQPRWPANAPFSRLGLKKNKNITSEFVAKYRHCACIYEILPLYISNYGYINVLNDDDFPLIVWKDFSVDYFNRVKEKYGVDAIDRIFNMNWAFGHPSFTYEHFERYLYEEMGDVTPQWHELMWTKFAEFSPNCTVKILHDHCPKHNIMRYYKNLIHEKREFEVKKKREYLAAYKIQQWWLFITMSPEYAVGRRRIEKEFVEMFPDASE